MNILELSTNDFGGAGYAALSFIEDLCKRGHYARLIVLNKGSKSGVSIGIFDKNKSFENALHWFYRGLAKIYKLLVIGKPLSKYNFNNVGLNRISAKKILGLYKRIPDIIIVGLISDFVTPKTIYELQKLTGAKVRYIMMDNSPITGGCHYPWNCNGYSNNCYPCPALSKRNKVANKTLMTNHRYITPEMSIAGTTNDIIRARKSLLFRESMCLLKVTFSRNAVYFDKQVGRRKWDIGDDRYVILCGALSLTDARKGFSEFFQSLEILKGKIDVSKVTIIAAGGQAINFPSGYDVRNVGHLSINDLFMAYCCSDLFVCPSLEDSGPMMINYGVMAYIPVVAFRMGVALDLIRHKENGYIAEWNNVEDFAEGINYCMRKKWGSGILEKMNNAIAEDIKQQILKDPFFRAIYNQDSKDDI